jgi:hypothetical protein
MARATKALITRQDLIDMAREGMVLLKPGTGIENSGILINKVLSRDEIALFAYIDGSPFDPENGEGFVMRQAYIGPEMYGPIPGFINTIETLERFVGLPSVGGIQPLGGTIEYISTVVPSDKNRMTHYGVDARFHDTIVSPALNIYSKTIHITNSRADSGLFTATLTVGKSGTTPTATYSRSSVGSTDLSGNIRLGNLVNFSLVPPSVWPTAGTLILEVFENSVLQFSKNLTISAYGTGSLSITDYPIKFGINYEFKGKSLMVTEFAGAFSNVTGQRACNLL